MVTIHPTTWHKKYPLTMATFHQVVHAIKRMSELKNDSQTVKTSTTTTLKIAVECLRNLQILIQWDTLHCNRRFMKRLHHAEALLYTRHIDDAFQVIHNYVARDMYNDHKPSLLLGARLLKKDSSVYTLGVLHDLPDLAKHLIATNIL